MTKPFFTPDYRATHQTRPYGVRVGLGLWLSLVCLALSIMIIAGVIMGLSESYVEHHRPVESLPTTEPIDLSQPAWAVKVPTLSKVRSLPHKPAQRHPLAPTPYSQFMRIGYAAYQKQDYHTALINFQRALAEKEADRYATEAITNTQAIIQKQREGSPTSN